MKKLKNGHHFVNIDCTEKFQITNPKVWVSGFLSVDRNGISALGIMKKLKNGHHFVNINCTEKFQITNPKVWVSGFLSVNISIGHYEKIEKWPPFCEYWLYGKFSNYQPPHPQSLGLWFSECQQKWNIHISHYEKIEKWPPFHKYQAYGKISNYWSPPKVWVSGFQSVNGNEISASVIMTKLKNSHYFVSVENWRYEFSVGSVFPITHPRFLFNIYACLCLKLLCVDIYAWWPFCTSKKSLGYPTSHLCVVLHFLIFASIHLWQSSSILPFWILWTHFSYADTCKIWNKLNLNCHIAKHIRMYVTARHNTFFDIQFRITLKSMRNHCHGQRKSITVQLNLKPVRRIELCTKVRTDTLLKPPVRAKNITLAEINTCALTNAT